MDDSTGCALTGVKGLADDVLTALGQHLHRHILWDHIIIDEGPQKFIFGFRGSREANLDLFKSNFQQQLVKLQLFFQAHGDDQALIAVTQVNAAPGGRLFHMVFFHPLVVGSGGTVITDAVLAVIHNYCSLS